MSTQTVPPDDALAAALRLAGRKVRKWDDASGRPFEGTVCPDCRHHVPEGEIMPCWRIWRNTKAVLLDGYHVGRAYWVNKP